MNIDWNVFDNNSSEREALIEFAFGRSIRYLRKNIYTKACIKEIGRIRTLDIKNARQRARRWAKKNGYDHCHFKW